MIQRTGNLWSVRSNLKVFTANSIIKRNGELVMGAGIAKQFKHRYPGIDKMFGNIIENNSIFGFKAVEYNGQLVGAFQTKVNWKNNSTLELIRIASTALIDYINNEFIQSVDMPYPGINNGNLSPDKVLPIIEVLPDIVTVWRLR